MNPPYSPTTNTVLGFSPIARTKPEDAIPSGEPGWWYSPSSGLVYREVQTTSGLSYEPSVPPLTYHRAYVVNPFAPDGQQITWKNVFDTPTASTVENIIDELKKVYPDAQFNYAEIPNYSIYHHSKQPYFITLHTGITHSIDLNAGQLSKLWISVSKGAMLEAVAEILREVRGF